MAEKQTIDVLMTFIQTSGQGVPSEASSDWDVKDSMFDEFQDGYYFEVEDWGFSAENNESEDKNDPSRGQSSRGFGTNTLHHLPGRTDSTTPGRNGGGQKPGQFPVDVRDITITKQVEWSSITLLQNCLNAVPFKKAILVKRKFTGARRYEAFLRVEFNEPLIKRVEWDEGEVMKEKVTFKCRGITVRYKQQLDDGTLDSATEMSWTPQRKLAAGGGQ